MKVVHKNLFPKRTPLKKTWFTHVSDFFLGILSLIKFNVRTPKPDKKTRVTLDDEILLWREKFRKELALKKELEFEKKLAQGMERTKEQVKRFNNNYKRKQAR